MSFLSVLEAHCPGDDAHDGIGDPRPLLERCGMCALLYEAHQAELDIHHSREKELKEKWKGVLAMMELVAAAHPCKNPHCSCREVRAKVDKALDIRAQADAKLKEKNP